jgi:GNAT superfamily N-acetyltransferase
MKIHVRQADAADMPEVHRLVKELAIFENSPEEVITTADQYVRDGFQNNCFQVLVAVDEDSQPRPAIVGMALYYPAYSTWRGPYLYLEDLIVTETYRSQGIGEWLFHALTEQAAQTGMKLIKWQVLDWNTRARAFYERLDARADPSWVNYRLEMP